MHIQDLDILLRLIIAHILADFPLQSNKMAKGKKKGLVSKHFYQHILIVGIVTYLLLGQWSNWLGPLIIMLIHGGVDAIKAGVESLSKWARREEKWLFAIDQALHLLTLLVYWAITSCLFNDGENFLLALNKLVFTNTDILVLAIAYLVLTMPVGILIGLITKKWQSEIKRDDNKRRRENPTGDFSGEESLKNAGKTIGIIERSLILTFILLSQYQAIGFLIAAKSVFRFGDLKETGQRKRTEYILIGTLLSFTISIVIGVIARYLIFGSI